MINRAIFILLCFSLLPIGYTNSAERASKNQLEYVKALIEKGALDQLRKQLNDAEFQKQISERKAMAIGDFLQNAGYPGLARDFLKQQWKLHPRSEKIARRLIAVYIELDQSAQAIPILQRLTHDHPWNRAYWLELGKIALWNEQQKIAIQAYQHAMTLDPSDTTAFHQLYRLYLWNDQMEKAFRLEKQILQLEPENWALWKQRAEHARWLNHLEDSVEALKIYLSHQPDDIEAWMWLGEDYLWLDQQDKAEAVFKHILARQPTNIRARIYFSQLRQWQPMGWWEARENYQRILRKNPNHAEARKNLQLIRQNFGPQVRSQFHYISDSNDLHKTVFSLAHNRYISARWELQMSFVYHRLEETKVGQRFASFGEGARVSAAFQSSASTRWTLQLGGIRFNKGELFGLVEARWQQTWPGQLVTTAFLRLDQVEDGVLAIQNEYLARRVGQGLFWQPHQRFRLSGEAQFAWYSDGNQKKQLYVLTRWDVLASRPKLFFFSILSFEDTKLFFPQSIPYWTPQNFWSRSLGLGLALPLGHGLSLEGRYALTQQTGNEVANNWQTELAWRISPFSHVRFFYQDYGSQIYAYRSLEAGFGFRW
ncbi:MAG: hypothetical protein D6814_12490 [Calditrichaeota bacterium]|nr:MAG: hypothetical protein D6814_12490 [Calditrichota bacterium]